MLVKKIMVRSYEVGLKFHDGEFKGILNAGKHWIVDPWNKVRVRVASMREPWLVDDQLDMIVKSGAIQGRAEVVDLKDYQRAIELGLKTPVIVTDGPAYLAAACARQGDACRTTMPSSSMSPRFRGSCPMKPAGGSAAARPSTATSSR